MIWGKGSYFAGFGIQYLDSAFSIYQSPTCHSFISSPSRKSMTC